MKNTAIGIVFAFLWASASAATKFGLQSAQPLVIANFRFFIAAILMLAGAHLLRGYRLPTRAEWKPLLIYGFLNVTLYLGAFVYAMKGISAGIGSLSVATNPLIISVLAVCLSHKADKTLIINGLVATERLPMPAEMPFMA